MAFQEEHEQLLTLNALSRVLVGKEKAGGWESLTPDSWHNNHEIPVKLLLVITELAEAIEGMRVDDKANFDEEIVDALIRLLSVAGGLEIDLDKWLAYKVDKNRSRGHRHGGKRF